MCETRNNSNLSGDQVLVQVPDPAPYLDKFCEIGIIFNTATKKLHGLRPIVSNRESKDLVSVDGSIGKNERNRLVRSSDEFIQLLDRFVHDLCSLPEFST